MILDSSAIVAIVLREPSFDELFEKLAATPEAGVGAPTLGETGLVLSARLGRDAWSLVARLVQEFSLVVVPFGEEHARAAVAAFVRYGKGRHPAALNFGDCMTYAVAKFSGQPVLCVGNDFEKTDLEIA